MTLYNSLYDFLFRLKDKIRGNGVYRLFDTMLQEQYLPPAQLTERQNKRLQNILQHAVIHSPYYRKLWEQHNITIEEQFDITRLATLPLLERENLQESWREILCTNAANVFKNATGGSTGNPVNFFQDENYAKWSEAHNLLFLSWLDIHPADRTAVIWGADRDLSNLSFGDKLYNRIHRIKQLNSFAMSDELLEQFINEINRFRPVYIYGYASSLHLTARFINNTKPLTFTPKAVRSSAEMLYDFQRKEIERAFRTNVYNFYGSREINNLAAECPAHKGLHIFASGRIVEIVDDNGQPVPDGTVGNIVVTDLTNYSFPFIRYKIGDLAVKMPSDSVPCSCGRTYPRLERIEGRSTDIIVINGQYIHGEYFTHLFYGKPEIKQFQVVQETADSLLIRVVSTDENPNLDDIIKSIKTKAGSNISVTVVFVDEIPPLPSGKHRFTISLLEQEEKNGIA